MRLSGRASMSRGAPTEPFGSLTTRKWSGPRRGLAYFAPSSTKFLMEWIQPLRVASAMTKSGRTRFAVCALRWKLPKSWPTMGSSQTRCRLGSPIMLLSHVLPLRPEPKIQTMFSGLTPVPEAPSKLLRSEAVRRGTSLYLPASQRRPLRSTPGRPSIALLSPTPNATLPAAVLLVTEPDQQLPSLLLEDAPVLLSKVVLPVPRNTFTIERRVVLLSPLTAPGELLEARRANAVLHQPLVCVDPEEAEQPLYLFVGTLQQVFVAHLGIAVPEQSRAVFDGPAHKESPVPGRLPQPLLCKRARRLPPPLAQSLTPCQFLGRESVEVALAGAAPPTVHGGDRPVPAIPYDVDHPGPWVHGADLLHESFVQERRLIPDEPLVGLRELGGEKVLCGQTHQGVYVLVGISIPAPHRAFDPEPQVL